MGDNEAGPPALLGYTVNGLRISVGTANIRFAVGPAVMLAGVLLSIVTMSIPSSYATASATAFLSVSGHVSFDCARRRRWAEFRT